MSASSAQLSSVFSKIALLKWASWASCLSWLSNDSAKSDVTFCQVDSYWFEPLRNSKYLDSYWLIFYSSLKKLEIFQKIREKWKVEIIPRPRTASFKDWTRARPHQFMQLTPVHARDVKLVKPFDYQLIVKKNNYLNFDCQLMERSLDLSSKFIAWHWTTWATGKLACSWAICIVLLEREAMCVNESRTLFNRHFPRKIL